MTTQKRVADLRNGEKFQYNGRIYLLHAAFMEGFANTRMVVTETGNLYDRMPKDLTLRNNVIVETI